MALKVTREELPVTPGLVTWARTRSGLSLDEASKTFKRIREWEDGTSSPTYSQLETLADAFKVPVAVFFFPDPPDIPDISGTFRTLPDAEFQEIPSKLQLLLRKAKALQLNLLELTAGRPLSDRLITRDLAFDVGADLRQVADHVRAYLGISLDVQQGWPDDDVALKEWRKALFAAGIYVFKDAFRNNEFSGFCLYDDIIPIIYANNSSAKTRQIFTLFHELGHLLYHTSGIDKIHDDFVGHLHDDAQAIEIFCNRFAAEFLLPDRVFADALASQKPTEGTAERFAARFHVSREFIFRRFLDRGLIDEATYASAANRWAKQMKEGSGGDYYWTKLSYLGRDYVALALGEFRRNRISESQLADYLDTKPRNLAGIEEYFARGGA
jgi:Zn-dependent peptidase ImmA (M78 family)/transcriptional regulator with XRE-family HTH domain